jgi:hypothetical protein
LGALATGSISRRLGPSRSFAAITTTRTICRVLVVEDVA